MYLVGLYTTPKGLTRYVLFQGEGGGGPILISSHPWHVSPPRASGRPFLYLFSNIFDFLELILGVCEVWAASLVLEWQHEWSCRVLVGRSICKTKRLVKFPLTSVVFLCLFIFYKNSFLWVIVPTPPPLCNYNLFTISSRWVNSTYTGFKLPSNPIWFTCQNFEFKNLPISDDAINNHDFDLKRMSLLNYKKGKSIVPHVCYTNTIRSFHSWRWDLCKYLWTHL